MGPGQATALERRLNRDPDACGCGSAAVAASLAFFGYLTNLFAALGAPPRWDVRRMLLGVAVIVVAKREACYRPQLLISGCLPRRGRFGHYHGGVVPIGLGSFQWSVLARMGWYCPKSFGISAMSPSVGTATAGESWAGQGNHSATPAAG